VTSVCRSWLGRFDSVLDVRSARRKETIYDAEGAASRVRRVVPSARVDIIPGVEHMLGMERLAVINPRVKDFLIERVPSPVIVSTASSGAFS
jgi:hypothetical protein